jgi:hypothetical protein
MPIQDKPGRRISLSVIYDHKRGLVQIFRQLHNTKGFVTDSGNMGQMPLADWRKFLSDQVVLQADQPTLMEQFGF